MPTAVQQQQVVEVVRAAPMLPVREIAAADTASPATSRDGPGVRGAGQVRRAGGARDTMPRRMVREKVEDVDVLCCVILPLLLLLD